jgi:hypothetical protein
MEQSVGGHGNYRLYPENLAVQSGFYILDFHGKIKFPVEPFQFAQ